MPQKRSSMKSATRPTVVLEGRFCFAVTAITVQKEFNKDKQLEKNSVTSLAEGMGDTY